MAIVISREAYFATGLDVLADRGYGGLKLAEVCDRLGVTSGSFYHYFANWPAYTRELVHYWFEAQTRRQLELLKAAPEPRKRLAGIIETGLALPTATEAAFRSWSSVDPYIRSVQVEVDRQRYEFIRDSSFGVLGDERQAQLFAEWAVYLLVGFEQCTLPPDVAGIAWISAQLLDALDSGRFASVPKDD